MEREKNKSSNIFLIFGLFILEFILFIISTVYFYQGNHIIGLIFLVLAVASNVIIFVKGRKIATIFGVLFLIFILFISLGTAIYGFSLTKQISEEEKTQILEEKKEPVDTLFKGYESGDYDKYSRDLSDSMKEQHDKIEFIQLREGFGKIISRDCSSASKSTMGGPVVLCNVEFENAKTRWDIRFTNENEIWGLYFEVINPEIELQVLNKKILSEISVICDGNEGISKPSSEEGVLLVFDISIKNDQENQVTVHSFTFESKGYSFGQLIFEEGCSLECNNLVSEVLAPNEEKQGCIIFSVVEGYTDGEIKVE